MTTQTILRADPLHAVTALLKRIQADLAKRRRAQAAYSKTYSELSRFTDRQLADIGVNRSQIGDIATEAAAVHK